MKNPDMMSPNELRNEVNELRHLIGAPVEHEFIYTVTGRVISPQMCYREFMPHTAMDRWVRCHIVDDLVVLGPAKVVEI